MVAKVVKIIRKMVQEIRPFIYFCLSPDSVVYHPDEYTEEIYIEETTPDFPFDNSLYEWRLYAEEEKDREVREAIERRFNLSQKPTLCLILEKTRSSAGEEFEYEEIEEVEIPKFEQGIIEKIKERMAESEDIDEKLDYQRQIDAIINRYKRT